MSTEKTAILSVLSVGVDGISLLSQFVVAQKTRCLKNRSLPTKKLLLASKISTDYLLPVLNFFPLAMTRARVFIAF